MLSIVSATLWRSRFVLEERKVANIFLHGNRCEQA